MRTLFKNSLYLSLSICLLVGIILGIILVPQNPNIAEASNFCECPPQIIYENRTGYSVVLEYTATLPNDGDYRVVVWRKNTPHSVKLRCVSTVGVQHVTGVRSHLSYTETSGASVEIGRGFGVSSSIKMFGVVAKAETETSFKFEKKKEKGVTVEFTIMPNAPAARYAIYESLSVYEHIVDVYEPKFAGSATSSQIGFIPTRNPSRTESFNAMAPGVKSYFEVGKY